jgi:type IV secretion system protein VirB9
MKRGLLIILTYGLWQSAVPAYAGLSPSGGVKDSRIKTFAYEDDQVYSFTGHYGFSSLIEFLPEETIDTVSIGDSESWQIVPSNKRNILFVKPVLPEAQTNMTVITSARIYSFELVAEKATSESSDELAYRIKFLYPSDEDSADRKKEEKYDPFADKKSNEFSFAYSYAGSHTAKPLRVFDDGNFTYFQFSQSKTMPAIFSVSEDGSEALINFTIKDDYVLIPGIYAQFTLRAGDEATCIFNDLLQQEEPLQKG